MDDVRPPSPGKAKHRSRGCEIQPATHGDDVGLDARRPKPVLELTFEVDGDGHIRSAGVRLEVVHEDPRRTPEVLAIDEVEDARDSGHHVATAQ
jgi:hypothetical protein